MRFHGFRCIKIIISRCLPDAYNKRSVEFSFFNSLSLEKSTTSFLKSDKTNEGKLLTSPHFFVSFTLSQANRSGCSIPPFLSKCDFLDTSCPMSLTWIFARSTKIWLRILSNQNCQCSKLTSYFTYLNNKAENSFTETTHSLNALTGFLMTIRRRTEWRLMVIRSDALNNGQPLQNVVRT